MYVIKEYLTFPLSYNKQSADKGYLNYIIFHYILYYIK